MRKGAIATARQAERVMNTMFYDAIAWAAARVLLVRVTADPSYQQLSPELRASIATFLTRHPRKSP